MSGDLPVRTIPDLLARRVEQTPDGLAFGTVAGAELQRGVTWREFATQARAIAASLRELGLRPGDRLGIIAPTSIAWEMVHHGALAAGAVVVGMDPHDTPDRLQRIVEIARIRAVVLGDATIAGKLGDRFAQGRIVITLEGDATGRFVGWKDLPPGGKAGDEESPRPESIATIIFTSGTTGAPKGIAYSHEQVLLATQAIAREFAFIARDSRLLCWLPLSNLFQRMVNLAGIAAGCSTFMLSDPRRVLDAVRVVEPDVFIGVPRFFEKFHAGLYAQVDRQPPLRRTVFAAARAVGRKYAQRVRAGEAPPGWLRLAHALADRWVLRQVRLSMGRRLRCLVTGSAPTPVWLLEELHAFGLLVLEAYGLSEDVVPIAINHPDSYRFGSVGKPLGENEVRIGEDGEVLVRGPGLFAGYLQDDPTEESQLTADGYLRTGDYGHIDEDGFLFLTGRKSDVIKTSSGRRIAPAGIEAALKSVPDVEQVVVMGAGRKCLVAIIVPGWVLAGNESGMSISDRRMALVASLAGKTATLAPHEQPAGFLVLARGLTIEDGELTPNLKLRRRDIERNHAVAIGGLYDAIENTPSGELPATVFLDR